jgi:TRAP-type mannitol/chloroaromatic compound transport system permease small subunit
MPKFVQVFIDCVTAMNRWVFKGATLLMFVIVPVMLFAVLARYGFNSPSAWAMELALMLFGPYFLMIGPYLLHERGHVNLDLVQLAVGPQVRRVLELINYPVIIAFAGILLVYAVPFAVQSFEYRETTYSSWNPPIWPVKLFVPLALVLLGLQATAEWLRMLFIGPVQVNDADREGQS